jgi:hypothetical protein
LTLLSTEEAEFIAANEGIRALSWVRSLVVELGLNFVKPKVYKDNGSAVLWITDLKIKMKTIHFDIQLAFAHKCYENGIFIIQSVETENNVADIITKVLRKRLNFKHLTSIMKELQGRISDSRGVSDEESSGTFKLESFGKVLRFSQ